MARTALRYRGSALSRREAWQGYIFASPWIAGFLLFTAGPMLFSLYASFTNYDITSRMNWIGLRNYETMFSHDPLFWKSLWNTFYYVIISVPLQTAGGLLLAVVLNRKVAGIRIFRTVFYLPSILSGVGVYVLWMMLLSPSAGLVNLMLGWVGVDGPAWLTDPAWTKNAVILMKIWGAGGMMLLYLASLQSVPKRLYEAAELDGAGRFRKFWHVTLPMITPVIFFEIVTGMIGGFQIFQEGYVMGYNNEPGAPMNSLLFYNLHMFLKAFKVFDMGYAMAMAWFLFLIVLALTLVNLILSRLWVHYEGGDQ
ncbi:MULTISPECIES: carbohydrate ABC transporter permease [Paenibacillus]|uniref:carbohydrate ABC transporter permease n=1 Tax=Paenibacillus TaxID=44249 RepID=UPI0008386B11|nr:MULTISPECIES: sugar ABC transporter permease [Paenibacillus]GIP23852.1 spermidine/putrescine ABC transporter permease [Paenibacillus sp. J22TS3]